MTGLLGRLRRRARGHLRYGRLGSLYHRVQRRDDHDWRSYTEESYKEELVRLARSHAVLLESSDIRDSRIASEKPLHPSHLVIYETARLLRPTTILEVGAGGGDHMANLGLLLPDVEIRGVDVSKEQRAFARERHGDELADRITLADFTEPGLQFSAELVFTQAVAMHIHGPRYWRFLENLWAATERWLLLVENWRRHDFVRDLARFGTPQLVNPYAILLAKAGPDARFHELRSDRELRAGVGL